MLYRGPRNGYPAAMKLHVVQHVPYEGLGTLRDWFAARNLSPSWLRFHQGDRPLPAAPDDFLVVLGGPMGVYETAAHPWLEPELDFVRAAVESGTKVLGICLGAQLVAAALGARVYPHSTKEIGWFPITASHGAGAPLQASGFILPPSQTVLHWHGDTFDLPRGANLLASSEATPHQAFSWGSTVLALQFHLEMDPRGIQAMVEHSASDTAQGPWINPPHDILDGYERWGEKCRASLYSLMDAFADY